MSKCVLVATLIFVFCGCGSEGASSGEDAVANGPTGASDPTDETLSLPDGGIAFPDGLIVPPEVSQTEGITYHGAARAVLETHCTTCHADEGIAPFAMGTYEEAQTAAPLISIAVHTGAMPPWMPSDDCVTLEDPRGLDEEERAILLDWVADGALEGDPETYTPPAANDDPGLNDPDLVFHALEPYVPDVTASDDYRCLILDHVFEVDTFVEAVHVQPDLKAVVHHVLLYVVSEAEAGLLAELDAKDPGSGYHCLGGPKVGQGSTLGAWVPGMVPALLPEGAALLIPAGSQVVAQLHYNTLNIPKGEEAQADDSAIALWTLEPNEVPTSLVRISPIANHDILIPPDVADVSHTKVYLEKVGRTLIGIGPHMHLLGTSISLTVERASGESECLIDIPDWDFNWQQFYRYPESSFVDIQPGDTIEMTCIYDNTQANQPIVGGEQQEPTVVEWGEETTDEMCITYLISIEPYHPDEGICGGFAGCMLLCEDGDVECFAACVNGAGNECTECFIPAAAACSQEYCPADLSPLLACLETCEPTLSCLVGDCAEEFQVLYTCLEPAMKSGACNAALTHCDVAF